MDREPDRLIKPHSEDNELGTGETVVHLLAREGSVETLRKILNVDEKPRIPKPEIVRALLLTDNEGWTPLMSAVKADKHGEKIIKLFLDFIDKECAAEDMAQIIGEKEACSAIATEQPGGSRVCITIATMFSLTKIGGINIIVSNHTSRKY